MCIVFLRRTYTSQCQILSEYVRVKNEVPSSELVGLVLLRERHVVLGGIASNLTKPVWAYFLSALSFAALRTRSVGNLYMSTRRCSDDCKRGRPTGCKRRQSNALIGYLLQI